MAELNHLQVVQVSTSDIAGGAEKIAMSLHQAYRNLGYSSHLIVGFKHSQEKSIIKINNYFDQERWKTGINALKNKKGKNLTFLRYVLRILTLDWHAMSRWLGYEDFHYPDSLKIFYRINPPDVIHAHNLHGGYFDLNILYELSHRFPLILTLHDEWLLTGHCAHSINCQRWMRGCGHCPDLERYPGINHDLTAFNFRRKERILSRSSLFIVTPSRWLMEKINQSTIQPILSTTIPNGIDLNVFREMSKESVKASLGIPKGNFVLLFLANRGKKNVYKDFETVRQAVDLLRNHQERVTFIILGGEAEEPVKGAKPTIHVPFQSDPYEVAKYYQAADIFLHATKADTFPTTVLEALCCGTPVIATAVGGIPEQIKDGETGFLVSPGDAVAMASKAELLLGDGQLRQQMSAAAAQDGKLRFDQNRMVQDYLDFYEETIETWKKRQDNPA